jgi:hypothetical protein
MRFRWSSEGRKKKPKPTDRRNKKRASASFRAENDVVYMTESAEISTGVGGAVFREFHASRSQVLIRCGDFR